MRRKNGEICAVCQKVRERIAIARGLCYIIMV